MTKKRINKEWLHKVLDWLKPQITPAVWERIRENWPGIDEEVLRRADYEDTVIGLSVTIQIILDAMAGRYIRHHTFGDGLPKSYVVEIAQRLDIDTRGRLKEKLIELIEKKIK